MCYLETWNFFSLQRNKNLHLIFTKYTSQECIVECMQIYAKKNINFWCTYTHIDLISVAPMAKKPRKKRRKIESKMGIYWIWIILCRRHIKLLINSFFVPFLFLFYPSLFFNVPKIVEINKISLKTFCKFLQPMALYQNAVHWIAQKSDIKYSPKCFTQQSTQRTAKRTKKRKNEGYFLLLLCLQWITWHLLSEREKEKKRNNNKRVLYAEGGQKKWPETVTLMSTNVFDEYTQHECEQCGALMKLKGNKKNSKESNRRWARL